MAAPEPKPSTNRPQPGAVLMVKSININTQAEVSQPQKPKSKNTTALSKPSAHTSHQRRATKTTETQRPLEQLFLNFSNSPFASTIYCSQCRMSYVRGAQTDTVLHDKHHRSVLNGVRYKLGSEKAEHVLDSYVLVAQGQRAVEGSIVHLPPHAKKVSLPLWRLCHAH